MYAPDPAVVVPPVKEEGEDDNNAAANAEEAANNDGNDEAAAAIAENADGGAATPGGTGGKSTSRLHRSLPRVKALLEDENYLSGILQACESSGCASQPVATSNNAWMTAFNSVYTTVAVDCHLPQGKNRHHKFKDKVVEVWQAMEIEIAEKKQSITHPLYALGMKQLETHRSVAKTTGGDGAGGGDKSPKRGGGKAAGQSSSAVPSSAGGCGADNNNKTPSASAPAGRKKTRGASNAAAAASAAASQAQAADLAKIFRQGFSRLESLATQQLAPALPSPLHEMHRIRLQLQLREDADLLANLEPYYSEAVGNYLAQVTSQANNSAHPAMLPKVLEGLDYLLQADHDAQLEASIRYTYKAVFQTYLKLINPDISAAAAAGIEPPSQAPGSSRKRKARDDKKRPEEDGDEGTAV